MQNRGVADYPPNTILAEIEGLIRKKPAEPGEALSRWSREIIKRMCEAPLKLISERGVYGTDGHPYFIFQLPEAYETAREKYVPYKINEEAETLIEFSCGAAVIDAGGSILANIPLGLIINLARHSDPTANKDAGAWGWPHATKAPEGTKINKISKTRSGLPEPTIRAIDMFLRSVRPAIVQWGVLQRENPPGQALYFQAPLDPKDSDPKPILEHLTWFTPHTHPWVCTW